MENLKKIISTIFFYLLFFAGLSFLFSNRAYAQILILDPSTATKKAEELFTVDLIIDTQEKPIVGADAKIIYDATVMEVVSVTKGDFFDVGASNFSDPGKLYILGAYDQAMETSVENGKVKGKIATITLKGKKVGTSQLAFVCSTQTNDSNIIDATSNDLIKCTGIKDGAYTFTEGGATTPTSTPNLTSTPVPTSPVPTSIPTSGAGTTTTSTPTPTPPVSGLALPTIFSFGLGAVLTIIGLAIIF